MRIVSCRCSEKRMLLTRKQCAFCSPRSASISRLRNRELDQISHSTVFTIFPVAVCFITLTFQPPLPAVFYAILRPAAVVSRPNTTLLRENGQMCYMLQTIATTIVYYMKTLRYQRVSTLKYYEKLIVVVSTATS